MSEYSKSAAGNFISTGAAQAINLPFIPNRVKFTNYTATAAFANHGIPNGYWSAGMGQGFATCEVVGAGPVLEVGVVLTQGISTFSGGLSQQYGAAIGIASITAANPTVVTTTVAHGYKVGDTVVLQGLNESATTGMQQIAGIPFTISVVGSTTTFTIKWDTNQTNFTALTASPPGAFVKKVLYPFLYLPEDNVISAITTGTTTTVVTTMYHNMVVGQQVAFRIPSVYGTTQLNSLPNNVVPGSPIYGYVQSITDNWTVVVNTNSTGYTAFNSNQPFANYPGLQFPQIVPVGDVNSGGWPYTGGSLYPSPSFPTSSGGVPTINGPAIQGAFVNNTSQGFIIGAGNAVVATTADTSSHLVGASSDVIYWEAFLDDIWS